MPSNAYLNFKDHLMTDVIRLYESHCTLNSSKPGRRGLGHITRSGVFMLCAAWEMYHEDLIKECTKIIIDNTQHPSELNRSFRKEIIDNIGNRKDKTIILSMAGDGWKQVIINLCYLEVDTLNTPKTKNIRNLYRKYIGIENIDDNWSVSGEKIDKFVSDRGDIAHKGSSASYIKISHFKNYMNMISKAVIENDKLVLTFLKDKYPDNRVPWNNSYTFQKI